MVRLWATQCPPKEFASLVKAFNKIAAAFEAYQTPEDVGFQSEILNDVFYALPRLKEPVRSILAVFNLSKAVEDKRDELWYDEEKYPSIADTRCVRIPTVSLSCLTDQLVRP